MSPQRTPSPNEILRYLIEATDKEALRWTQTADEDAFRAQSDFGLIRIWKDPITSRYVLTLVDQDGTVLDEYETDSPAAGETTGLAFEVLYKKARQQALNLDQKLQAFFDRLRSLAEGS